jgi:hypothetical protein
MQYKTAFALAHKIREALGSEVRQSAIGEEGKRAEVDGGYFSANPLILLNCRTPVGDATAPVFGRRWDQRGGNGEGGGGGDDPPRHPLIEGLFQSLPKDGDPMTTEEAIDSLQAAAYNLGFAYKFQGCIKVTIEDQGSSSVPVRNSGGDAA